MSYSVKFNDTSQINKPFYQAVLEGVYIGKMLNLEIHNYPVIKIVKNFFRYTFSNPNLHTLKESQIRKIEDYIIVRDHLVRYYQLQIPYLANNNEIEQNRTYQEFGNFIENTQFFSEIDLFYYDRAEQINDYHSYFEQLDNKLKQTNVFTTPEGEQLSYNLRFNMENYLQEMFDTYKSRTREVFMVIHTPIIGTKVENIIEAKQILDTKVSKTISALREMGINHQEVEGQHLDWLLHNFVSNTTNY